MSDDITISTTQETIALSVQDAEAVSLTVSDESIVLTVSAAVAQAALPETILAGANLSAYKAIRSDGNGGFVYADNSIDKTVYGLTVQAIVSGSTGRVQTSGIVENSTWDWTPNVVIFLGGNGELTQGLPLSGYLVPIATALTAQKIQIRVQNPFYLGG